MWPWSLEHRLARLEKCDDERREEIKKLSERISEAASATSSRISAIEQKSKESPSAELLERLESLERRFSSLHSTLTEKTPATGKERLSRTGQRFKRLFG